MYLFVLIFKSSISKPVLVWFAALSDFVGEASALVLLCQFELSVHIWASPVMAGCHSRRTCLCLRCLPWWVPSDCHSSHNHMDAKPETLFSSRSLLPILAKAPSWVPLAPHTSIIEYHVLTLTSLWNYVLCKSHKIFIAILGNFHFD